MKFMDFSVDPDARYGDSCRGVTKPKPRKVDEVLAHRRSPSGAPPPLFLGIIRRMRAGGWM